MDSLQKATLRRLLLKFTGNSIVKSGLTDASMVMRRVYTGGIPNVKSYLSAAESASLSVLSVLIVLTVLGD